MGEALAFTERHVRLELPRFKVDSGSVDLRGTLKMLGVQAGWDEYDFTRMSHDPRQLLMKVFQHVVVEVSEEDAAAPPASVTAWDRCGRDKGAGDVSVQLNRPF